jgi:hypothetical protein
MPSRRSTRYGIVFLILVLTVVGTLTLTDETPRRYVFILTGLTGAGRGVEPLTGGGGSYYHRAVSGRSLGYRVRNNDFTNPRHYHEMSEPVMTLFVAPIRNRSWSWRWLDEKIMTRIWDSENGRQRQRNPAIVNLDLGPGSSHSLGGLESARVLPSMRC